MPGGPYVNGCETVLDNLFRRREWLKRKGA